MWARKFIKNVRRSKSGKNKGVGGGGVILETLVANTGKPAQKMK